jgi:mevalonate kinase
VEIELRAHLADLQDTRDQKSQLMHRIDDLNGQLQTITESKQEKDSKLKLQINKNQDLLKQLDILNLEMN